MQWDNETVGKYTESNGKYGLEKQMKAPTKELTLAREGILYIDSTQSLLLMSFSDSSTTTLAQNVDKFTSNGGGLVLI